MGHLHTLRSQASVSPPPLVPGEGHTRLRGGDGGPNSDEGTDSDVLFFYILIFTDDVIYLQKA